MTFVNPLALLGLAAAAIPALLHLLQRRVPPELDFPAVRYLTVAERESARRLKLRHLLLLILRTTLIVVIVLGAARPLVRMKESGGGGGGGAWGGVGGWAKDVAAVITRRRLRRVRRGRRLRMGDRVALM